MIGVSATEKLPQKKRLESLRQSQNFSFDHLIKDADYFGPDNVASSDFLCSVLGIGIFSIAAVG